MRQPCCSQRVLVLGREVVHDRVRVAGGDAGDRGRGVNVSAVIEPIVPTTEDVIPRPLDAAAHSRPSAKRLLQVCTELPQLGL